MCAALSSEFNHAEYQKMPRSFVAALATCLVVACPASAATISSFARGVNDGVFTLTQAQKDFFGVAGAEYLAFWRPRLAGSTTATLGDTFNATTVLNSVTGDSAILAILNGDNAALGYSGGYLEPLGTTTILAAQNSYVRGVAFLLGSTGTVLFAGGNITGGSGPQQRGTLDFVPPITPVPLPAAGWMLIVGLCGLMLVARGHKTA
jgi:hypothetical protein